MKKNMKSYKGMTLISLLIAAIIVPMLLTVALNMSSQENIYDYAENAVSEYQNALDAEITVELAD